MGLTCQAVGPIHQVAFFFPSLSPPPPLSLPISSRAHAHRPLVPHARRPLAPPCPAVARRSHEDRRPSPFSASRPPHAGPAALVSIRRSSWCRRSMPRHGAPRPRPTWVVQPIIGRSSRRLHYASSPSGGSEGGVDGRGRPGARAAG
uniref:Uncharacterized protein n=1 Tax=Setaria viridis TaxID=4556 RepID=A0A4U6VUZ9_SETVI|nr:hypothetical protein SEVIR_2G261000v2 [Setaria viridis]